MSALVLRRALVAATLGSGLLLVAPAHAEGVGGEFSEGLLGH